jgi:hypothetical protein
MPRDVTVTFADGSSHVYKNAPDNLTPDQVSARAQQEFGKQVAALDGGKPAGGVVAKLKSWGSDLARGALNLPTMLADAHREGPEAQQALYAIEALAPKAGKQIREAQLPQGAAAATLTKALPKDPTANPYRTAALEALGGQLTMPVGGLGLKGFTAAGLGGIGSEFSAQTLGEGPLQRFLGGMLGGVAGGKLARAATNRVSPNAANLAHEAIEGISSEQLKAAQDFQGLAKTKFNVNLDLAQALESVGVPASNLTTLRNTLAQSRHGTKVQATLREQPRDLEIIANLTGDMQPGTNRGLPQAANNMQEAATRRVGQVAQERTEAVRELYGKVGQLPEDVQHGVLAKIEEYLTQPNLTDAAKAAGQELRKKFVNASATAGDIESAKSLLASATKPSAKLAARSQLASANQGATGAQPMHALQADVAINDVVGNFKGSPTYQANPRAAGQVRQLAAMTNEELKKYPPINAAETRFAQLSGELVNPVKQGPVGSFATPRGYLPDRSAAQTKLVQFFDAGSDPNSKTISPVRVLGKELSKSDPDAFQDGFKTWLSDKIQRHAASELTTGQVQPAEYAAGVYGELFKDPRRWQGMKDAVSIIAEQNGQNPGEAVKGLTNLAMTFKGAAQRPSVVRGVTGNELAQMAGESKVANTLRVFGFMPIARAAQGVEDAVRGGVYRTFDDLLTSPEGAATLVKLAKAKPGSQQFETILQGFTIGGQQGNLGVQNLQQNMPR